MPRLSGRHVSRRSTLAGLGITTLALPSASASASDIEPQGTPPSAPATVAATREDGRMTATWTVDSEDGVTGYVIEYAEDGSDTWLEAAESPVTGTPPARELTVTGLTNGTAYVVRVSVVADGLTGSSTTSLAVTPVAAATGGTTAEAGGYRTHRMTTDSSLTFALAREVEYLVVGGGGGGGAGHAGGGGGAGAVVTASGVSVAAGDVLTVSIGLGGTGGRQDDSPRKPASEGGSTSLSGSTLGVTAAGGGRGASGDPVDDAARSGGSGGGGAGGQTTTLRTGAGAGSGAGTTAGGGGSGAPSAYGLGGGGGGSSTRGGDGLGADPDLDSAGDGGDGAEWPVGSGEWFAGGGGGGGWQQGDRGIAVAGGSGGRGGGGAGGNSSAEVVRGADATGFGSGGGGAGVRPLADRDGGDGSSGIVIIRYLIGP